MYKLCKTEQSASRQQTLEAGLLAAMSTRHYDEISVSDLCDQMGIPRKSFYRYFSGKDGALQALLDHTLMEFESFALELSEGKKRTVRSEMEHFFQYWLHKKDLLDALQRSNLSSLLISRSISYASAGVTIPQRFLESENQDFREQVGTFAVCGLMSLVLEWHHTGYSHSVTHMASLAVRLISQPLFPNVQALL